MPTTKKKAAPAALPPPPPPARPPAAAAWVLFAVSILVVSAGGLWWVTAGLWEVNERAPFGDIFDALSRSFLEGRVNLDCNVAGGEAFVVDGKCYIYFGPVPALLRIPILAVSPSLYGRLCRLMVWAANLLLLLFLVLILKEAGHRPGSWAASGYLLLAAFGTTIPYMWGWPTGYVEAIAWATAFAAGSIYCLLRRARGESNAWLSAACLFGLCALFSRVNTGAGPLACAGFIALGEVWRGGPRRRAAIGILAVLAVFAGVFMAYNRARFGTMLDAVPVQYHVQYKGLRLERINGTLYHPIQAPPIFFDYLFHMPRFRLSYPWLDYNSSPAADVGVVDMHDPHTGALPVMPALAWLAWGGWRRLKGRRERWILLSPLPGLFMLAAVVCISHRYLHEFVLLLAPAAAYGIGWAWATARRRGITIALALFSIYANWSLALIGQREVLPWANPWALDNHAASRFLVDRTLGIAGTVPMPIEYDYQRHHPPPPVEGVQVRLAGEAGSRYQFSGGRWQLRAGPAAHRFTVRLRGGELSPRVVLLEAGHDPQTDLVTLVRGSGGRYRVCLEHFGTEAPRCGNEIDVQPGRDYEFLCDYDRLNRRAQVWTGGAVAAQWERLAIHPWSGTQVRAPGPAVLAP